RSGDASGFEDDDHYWVEELERDRSPEAEPDAKRELTDADRKQAEVELRKEIDAQIKDVERYTEEAIDRLQRAWLAFRDLKPRHIESDEQLFREMKERFGSPHGFGEYFRGGMGAAAIKELLEDMSSPSPRSDENGKPFPGRLRIDDVADDLREIITTSKG